MRIYIERKIQSYRTVRGLKLPRCIAIAEKKTNKKSSQYLDKLSQSNST